MMIRKKLRFVNLQMAPRKGARSVRMRPRRAPVRGSACGERLGVTGN